MNRNKAENVTLMKLDEWVLLFELSQYSFALVIF